MKQLPNDMEHSPSVANGCSLDWGIDFLWKKKVHHHVQNSSPLDVIFSQVIRVHIRVPFFKFDWDIILQFTHSIQVYSSALTGVVVRAVVLLLLLVVVVLVVLVVVVVIIIIIIIIIVVVVVAHPLGTLYPYRHEGTLKKLMSYLNN